MKKMFRKRALAAVLSAAMLSAAVPSGGIWAANVEETPDIQLQTILIDNNGKNWTTASWGGQNLTPNTNWTTLLLGDYYENGYLNFEVKNDNSSTVEFNIGLSSKKYNEQVKLYWTDMEEYQNISAGADWTSYSLPIKELVDANPDSGFDLDNFWLVYVNGVPSGNTLSFQNVTITSADDERQYPLIKVDQVGYYCNAAKTARVSYFEKFGSLSGKTYEIVNAENDEVVYTDTLPDAVYEETFSGEMVHTISFDEITEPGTYYIRIQNTGLDESARSPYDTANGLELDTLTSVKFTISDNVYDDLLSDLTKYYYYQRQGIEIEEEYAGVFARENLHPDDVTVKKWSDRDNPDAETFDVSGGWYDAGDYGKYVTPGANSVTDLLFAYEMNPEVFADLEMNIPETDPDNSNYADAPGILSEIKYELDMLLKLEHSSKDGSFYTAANYDTSTGVIYIEDTLYSTSNHESDPSETDLRCHLATADMAAVLAHAYIVYRDIPVYADFAEQCLETSLRAWDWINDPANTLNTSIGAANRTYTFKEADFERSRFQAAGTIYRAFTLRGDDAQEYEDYLIANCNTENVTNCFKAASIGYGHGGRSFLGFFQYLYENEAPASEITDAFAQYETFRARMLKYDTWGLETPGWGFWWGSNKYAAQTAMTLMLGDIAAYGVVQEDVQTSIENHVHYLLGVNPLSFSYVSGYGENSVENIFSAIYSKNAKLEPYQCPAGYFTEGANDSNNPHLSKFTGKCYIDSDGEWTTNENTIYGNAAMIFLTSSMMSQNAPEKVRGDVNADGSFTVADAVMLQKWLLCAGDITDWQAGDLCEDEKLDVFDLCIMKRELIPETAKNYVDVSTVEELFTAMRNAQPGDVIRAAGGTYDYTTYQGAQKIDTSAEGTQEAPITLTAADPENPPIITGSNTEHGYVIQITGDYWILENLKITTSQKGIVLDNSNHSIIRNCEVYNTGAEAIAIRDGSSYCTVKDSYIHDTGTVTPGYGEGVYIGSAASVTGFDYKCDYNTVDGCTFRNVAAEHVDVKEYTTGTEIMNCTFYGDGMTGANYAGSFVDIAGNDVNVHDNIGYRNGNSNIVAAFELHEQVESWGYHCIFTDNTLYMDQPYGAVDTSRRMYVVDGWYSDFSVGNNQVDYGNGLVPADSWEYYNSDYVTYLNQ